MIEYVNVLKSMKAELFKMGMSQYERKIGSPINSPTMASSGIMRARSVGQGEIECRLLIRFLIRMNSASLRFFWICIVACDTALYTNKCR